MAYIGCVAGAAPVVEYCRQLVAAGFAAVEAVPTESDLNAYAQVDGQAGCYSPGMEATTAVGGLPQVSSWCCTPTAAPAPTDALHGRLADLLRRYNVNDYAASVRVYAVRP